MDRREIINRLKITNYITSIDDPLGIAIRAGIDESSGGISREELELALAELERKIMKEVDKKESLSNKVNIGDPQPPITSESYPSAISVISALSQFISEDDNLLITCEI